MKRLRNQWKRTLLSRKIAFLGMFIFIATLAIGGVVNADDHGTAVVVEMSLAGAAFVAPKMELKDDASPADVASEINRVIKELGIAMGQGASKAEQDALKQTLDDLQTQMKALAENDFKEKISKLEKDLDKLALEFEANKSIKKGDSLLDVVSKFSKDYDATDKNIGDKGFVVDKTLVQTSSVTDGGLPMFDKKMGLIGRTRVSVYDLFQKITYSAPDGLGYIEYWQQKAITNNASSKAEGAAAPESAITWELKSWKVEQILDSIPITVQMLKNGKMFAGNVQNFIETNIKLKRDTLLLSGDGVSPNIKGVYTQASTFTAVAEALPKPNIPDLIVRVMNKIKDGNGNKYKPNFVMMNSATITEATDAIKKTDGEYIIPPFVTSNGEKIKNLFVIENDEMADNTLMVGDSLFGLIYESDKVNIEIGLNSDDFAKRRRTMLGYTDLVLAIKDVDTDAFYKVTDIDAAIITLGS